MKVDKASKIDVFRVANVPVVEAILRERRLRWLGHLLRSDLQDTAHQCLLREMGSGSPWSKIVLNDLQAVGVGSFLNAERLATNRVNWRAASLARPGLHVLRL